MSFKDKLAQAATLAEGLLDSVKKAFPEAAAEVAENTTGLLEEMKTELTEVVQVTKERADFILESVQKAWPFPTSTGRQFGEDMTEPEAPVAAAAKAPLDHFQLFRHVRDGSVVEGRGITSPHGGLSFYIDVKHKPEPVIEFATCVQGLDRNFQYRLGRNVSRGRFVAGQTITAKYDPNLSLLSNIQAALDDVSARATTDLGFRKAMLELKVDPVMVQTASNMLRVFMESLPREYPGDPK
jgi:hypothetical protein